MAFSPDGKRIVSGSRDKTVKVWDAASGQETPHPQGAHRRGVCSVAFSPDGKRIVSRQRGQDGEGVGRGERPGNSTLKGHTDEVSAAWPSAPTANASSSGSEDKTVKVWDAATGQEMLTLKGHTGGCHSVAFSPDGKRIVSGSHGQTR